MSSAGVVTVGILVAFVAMLAVAGVLVTRRKRLQRKVIESPADRYRREVPHLRGGGIHPGGQPLRPPRPDNRSGGNGAY
jgi:hypothetical protein